MNCVRYKQIRVVCFLLNHVHDKSVCMVSQTILQPLTNVMSVNCCECNLGNEFIIVFSNHRLFVVVGVCSVLIITNYEMYNEQIHVSCVEMNIY